MITRISSVLLVALVIGLGAGCAQNRSPQTIAATAAYNGTILVQSVGDVQKFVIAQEANGTIPRNTAVTAMEAIGRGLDAAQKASDYLKRLNALPTGSSVDESATLVTQVQESLNLITADVVHLALPGVSDTVQGQIVKLVNAVSSAINAANAQLLKYKGGK
jgi:hypothetical protein